MDLYSFLNRWQHLPGDGGGGGRGVILIDLAYGRFNSSGGRKISIEE